MRVSGHWRLGTAKGFRLIIFTIFEETPFCYWTFTSKRKLRSVKVQLICLLLAIFCYSNRKVGEKNQRDELW